MSMFLIPTRVYFTRSSISHSMASILKFTSSLNRWKFTFSVAGVLFFSIFTLLYLDGISILSPSSIISFQPCSRKDDHHRSTMIADNSQIEYRNKSSGDVVHARLEFNPNECSAVDGIWVFNASIEPLYTETSCPYLDAQFSCTSNGRPDSDYLHWEWQPEDCILPKFNPRLALKKIRGKRIMFVGDSLQRGQWQSFICMVGSVVPDGQKSMRRVPSHSVFTLQEYNATIEFYWAPFLIESNSDSKIIADPMKRILRVDSIAKHAHNWVGMDVLVFNTYVWWMSGTRIRSLWGSFANGEEGTELLDAPIAYRLALKTWANWIDSTVDPNNTRVFFTTMSPAHLRSVDWGHEDGIKCYNETRPVMKRRYWGTGSDHRIMSVVVSVLTQMKIPVTILNVTQMSEYRVDGHASVYTLSKGEKLTDEQKEDPQNYADCIHWCLPGVPDTWNQMFLAHL